MRRGDRVAVKVNDQVIVRLFVRQSLKRVELARLDDFEQVEVFDLSGVDWVSRIVWARQ